MWGDKLSSLIHKDLERYKTAATDEEVDRERQNWSCLLKKQVSRPITISTIQNSLLSIGYDRSRISSLRIALLLSYLILVYATTNEITLYFEPISIIIREKKYRTRLTH